MRVVTANRCNWRRRPEQRGYFSRKSFTVFSLVITAVGISRTR